MGADIKNVHIKFHSLFFDIAVAEARSSDQCAFGKWILVTFILENLVGCSNVFLLARGLNETCGVTAMLKKKIKLLEFPYANVVHFWFVVSKCRHVTHGEGSSQFFLSPSDVDVVINLKK